jgi:LacI family transcriptional regulator
MHPLFTPEVPRPKSVRNETNRPTLLDVARLAGVSAMTVSGVFRDPSDGYPVKAETRARVEAAAAKIGYRPNSVARAMRSRQFRDIGLLVVKPPQYLKLIPPTMAGVFDELNEANFQLTLIGLPPAPHTERIPRSFTERAIDSLIVDYTIGLPNEIRQQISAASFRTVSLNYRQPFNSVYVDDFAAATEATQYLIERGYRRIAFFSYHGRYRDAHPSIDERRRAFYVVMNNAGLVAREISVPDRPEGHKVAEEILRETPRPDALLCYGDSDAIFVQRALYRLNLKVPTDIALFTFKGDAYGFSPVPLTMMSIPWYDMGRAAARMAIELTNSADTPKPSVVHRAVLEMGESC